MNFRAVLRRLAMAVLSSILVGLLVGVLVGISDASRNTDPFLDAIHVSMNKSMNPTNILAGAVVFLFCYAARLELSHYASIYFFRNRMKSLRMKPLVAAACELLRQHVAVSTPELISAESQRGDLLWEYDNWFDVGESDSDVCNDMDNLTKGALRRIRRRRVTALCAHLLKPLQLSFCATEILPPSQACSLDADTFWESFSRRLMPWCRARRLLMLTLNELKDEVASLRNTGNCSNTAGTTETAPMVRFISWHASDRPVVPRWKRAVRGICKEAQLCKLRLAVDNRKEVASEYLAEYAGDWYRSFVDCAIYGGKNALVFARSGRWVLVRDREFDNSDTVKEYVRWFDTLWGEDGALEEGCFVLNSGGDKLVVSADIETSEDVLAFYDKCVEKLG